jgi:hypothetical protein
MRGRCFYCRDSRAADVEHYVPIALDPVLTFAWENLLWICPECNRRKVSRFPRIAGEPALIDPATTDPWNHLILVPDSGLLAPRYVGTSFDEKGEATLTVIAPINFESVTEGRRRAVRRLRNAVNDLIATGDVPEARRRLREAIEDDDHGVAAWFARCEGREDVPFVNLRVLYPAAWRKFIIWTTTADVGT